MQQYSDEERKNKSSEDTFNLGTSDEPDSVLQNLQNPQTVQIDTEEVKEEKNRIAQYETELDEAIFELRQLYEEEAAKFKLVQTETINFAISQLPPEITNMKLGDFIESCKDPEFEAQYNVPIELRDA